MPAWFSFPSGTEIVAAFPVIATLIVIEGLLSVDNALVIASLASRLPPEERGRAMRYGIVGAYLFRGVALALAAWILANPWVKICGALYLVWLMCSHLGGEAHGEAKGKEAGAKEGFWSVLLTIQLIDLSLSFDNVVAAVALSPKLWVVCTGVFIGILALRFLAGACVALIGRFPVLTSAAFLLVGYVGLLLLVEMLFRREVGGGVKFGGIGAILALSLAWERSVTVRGLLSLPVAWGTAAMRGVYRAGDAIFRPLVRAGKSLWK